MQNIGRDSLGVENHYARERPCPLKIRAAGQEKSPSERFTALSMLPRDTCEPCPLIIMIALPTKKREHCKHKEYYRKHRSRRFAFLDSF